MSRGHASIDAAAMREVVEGVASTLLGVDVTPASPGAGGASGLWTCCASLSGALDGVVTVTCEPSFAAALARVADPDVEPHASAACDALAELASVLAGNLRVLVAGGASAGLSPRPLVVDGHPTLPGTTQLGEVWSSCAAGCFGVAFHVDSSLADAGCPRGLGAGP